MSQRDPKDVVWPEANSKTCPPSVVVVVVGREATFHPQRGHASVVIARRRHLDYLVPGEWESAAPQGVSRELPPVQGRERAGWQLRCA